LANLGYDHAALGEFDASEATLGESLSLARAGGEVFTLSHVLTDFARLAYARKQYARSVAYARESLEVAERVERGTYRAFAVISALVTLGYAELGNGDKPEALSRFKEAYAAIRESRHEGFLLTLCLNGMASALSASGEHLRAAQLFGAAAAHLQRIRLAWRMCVERREEDVGAVETHLGDAAFRRAFDEGGAIEVERVVALAFAEVD
jgi:tetratricopeptide (TPR) repeat protein